MSKVVLGCVLRSATQGSAGGVGTADAMPLMPPQLEHGWLLVDRRHRVDAVRRVIHALNSHRALVFMNFQQRLNVRARSPAFPSPPYFQISKSLPLLHCSLPGLIEW